MNESPNLKSEWVELIRSFPEESSTLDILSTCINTFGDADMGLSFSDWGQIVSQCVERKSVVSEPNNFYIYRSSTDPIVMKYREWFSNMTVSNRLGKKAPHKYVLLISIFELIGLGVITSNRFGSIFEIEKCFLDNWESRVPCDLPFKPNYTLPFWHMKSEPFWTLYDKIGNRITNQYTKTIVSVKKQRSELIAEIPEELYEKVKEEASRNYLIKHLVMCMEKGF